MYRSIYEQSQVSQQSRLPCYLPIWTFALVKSCFNTNCISFLSQIDNVRLPSWQAQISGRKKWIFVPVLECAGICKDKYEVIVEKGDISECTFSLSPCDMVVLYKRCIVNSVHPYL